MDTDVLVIGGGAAGLAAATRLRSRAPTIRVTLVNPTPFNVYRPWFMYALPHLLPPEDLRISLAETADRHGFTFHQAEVDKLDPGSRTAVAGSESIQYRRVIVAAGAPTDHTAVAGAALHAVFPCDAAGFQEFQQRVDALHTGVVTIVLTGERVAPGLEDAAWLARARTAGDRPGVTVRLVDSGGSLVDQFGSKVTGRIRDRLEAWGAEVVLGTSVTSIDADAVVLADGRRLQSTVTALVGALTGPDIQTAELTDEHGFFPVDPQLRSVHEPTVFIAGDAVAQGSRPVRKNWQRAVRQAYVAADNAAQSMAGQPLVAYRDARDQRLSGFSLPDVGGAAYLVWNGKLLTAGRAARRIRIGFDRAHFAAYEPADPRWQRVPD
jgi:NADH:ubiquinone reductase (H+-translocating)